MNLLAKPVVMTAAAACSGLGADLAAMRAAILAGRHALRPLGEFGGLPARFAEVPGAWLEDRRPLRGRKYGAASNSALAIARQAITKAGWTAEQTAAAWVFAGSSRGNSCELLGFRHGRRPHALYAASNSMHSEIASCVSIECGIRAPWQLFSNGCSSGLDALIWAAHTVASGLAPRALAVSVDLPLVGALLEDFAATGLLTANGVNDPYSGQTSGFFPAEAAAAMTLEPSGRGTLLTGAWLTSDAYDPVGLPPDGEGIARVLHLAWDHLNSVTPGWRAAICPHASGTRAHGLAECVAIRSVLARQRAAEVTTHLLKPFTGHSLGASGALDAAILHEFLSRSELPPNLPGLDGGGIALPATPQPGDGKTVLKISVGMGGHNALLAMQAHPEP
jgi:3-oxoacyl-[acyl-carrier-protein] synthase II